jgi:carbon-monoxide dehydrogenase small subunit
MDTMPSEPIRVHLTINGAATEATIPAGRLLIEHLRDELGLTGTKEGCSVGVCGACSVLVDGRLMTACLLPLAALDGRSVQTVEGLAPPTGDLTPVQTAFIRHGGFQCGICTPGQVVAATALLAERPDPSEDEIRHWMTGNLCRCTGYEGIVASIQAAARDGSAASPAEGST